MIGGTYHENDACDPPSVVRQHSKHVVCGIGVSQQAALPTSLAMMWMQLAAWVEVANQSLVYRTKYHADGCSAPFLKLAAPNARTTKTECGTVTMNCGAPHCSSYYCYERRGEALSSRKRPVLLRVVLIARPASSSYNAQQAAHSP